VTLSGRKNAKGGKGIGVSKLEAIAEAAEFSAEFSAEEWRVVSLEPIGRRSDFLLSCTAVRGKVSA